MFYSRTFASDVTSPDRMSNLGSVTYAASALFQSQLILLLPPGEWEGQSRLPQIPSLPGGFPDLPKSTYIYIYMEWIYI